MQMTLVAEIADDIGRESFTLSDDDISDNYQLYRSIKNPEARYCQ